MKGCIAIHVMILGKGTYGTEKDEIVMDEKDVRMRL